MSIAELPIFNIKLFLKSARPEPVEGYLRALEDTLQQVQGERGIHFSNILNTLPVFPQLFAKITMVLYHKIYEQNKNIIQMLKL